MGTPVGARFIAPVRFPCPGILRGLGSLSLTSPRSPLASPSKAGLRSPAKRERGDKGVYVAAVRPTLGLEDRAGVRVAAKPFRQSSNSFLGLEPVSARSGRGAIYRARSVPNADDGNPRRGANYRARSVPMPWHLTGAWLALAHKPRSPLASPSEAGLRSPAKRERGDKSVRRGRPSNPGSRRPCGSEGRRDTFPAELEQLPGPRACSGRSSRPGSPRVICT